MERELLEEDGRRAPPRRDPDAAGAVEPEPHAESGLRGRPDVARAPGLRRVRARERSEQQVVVLAVAHRDADAAAGDPDDAAAREQPLGELVRLARRAGRESSHATRAGRSRGQRSSVARRSRSSITGATSGGERSAASASATESVDTGAGACRARSSAAVSRAASR